MDPIAIMKSIDSDEIIRKQIAWNGDPVILPEFCSQLQRECKENQYDGPMTVARIMESIPSNTIPKFRFEISKYQKQEINNSPSKIIAALEEIFSENDRDTMKIKSLKRLSTLACISSKKVRQYCTIHKYFVKKAQIDHSTAKGLFFRGLKSTQLISLAQQLNWEEMSYYELLSTMTSAAREMIWEDIFVNQPVGTKENIKQITKPDPREYPKTIIEYSLSNGNPTEIQPTQA